MHGVKSSDVNFLFLSHLELFLRLCQVYLDEGGGRDALASDLPLYGERGGLRYVPYSVPLPHRVEKRLLALSSALIFMDGVVLELELDCEVGNMV